MKYELSGYSASYKKLVQDKCFLHLSYNHVFLNCNLIINNKMFPILAPDFFQTFLTHYYGTG